MTVGQLLKTKKFPLYLYDSFDNLVYYETSNGWWYREEYDENNKCIEYENSYGHLNNAETDFFFANGIE